LLNNTHTSPSRRARASRDRLLYPVLIISAAVVIFMILVATTPELEPHPVARPAITVRSMLVEPEALHLKVYSQGTVQPHTESDLIPEVSGTVAWTAPALVSGGRFEVGETLLRLDQQDYLRALERARATERRALAELDFARSENDRLVSLLDRDLASRSQAQNAERALNVAQAVYNEAQSALQKAELDLQRTEIKAPFTGRVRTEQVDLGQFVQRGGPIATLYATDFIEVRLPVADTQLAFLDQELVVSGIISDENPPQVRLSATYAGKQLQWDGVLVRTDGEIDRKSRMVNVVARVQNPAGNETPLPVGLFVEAQIEGQVVDGVVRLPRQAIRDNDRVLVIDEQSRLHFRNVTVLRIERDTVLISDGLAAGERVCISPLQVVVEGMPVTLQTPQES